MAAALLVLMLGACRAAPAPAPAPRVDLVALNNRGVALMGRYEYEAAREAFARVVAAFPDRLDAQANLALATLNRQRDGDDRAAQALFEKVIAADSRHLRAHYGLGLVLLNTGRPADARREFEIVRRASPDDADAAYYAAQCAFQAGDFASALPGYERARALDPYLRSAAYGSFLTLQRLGREAEARRSLEVFQDLERNPQSRVAEFKYTRMGPLGEAVPIDAPAPVVAPKPGGPVVAAASTLVPAGALPPGWTWRAQDGRVSPSVTVVDLDGDGRLDAFVVGALEEHGRIRNAVLINRGDAGFTIDPTHPLALVGAVNAVLWGDYDNDGLTDAYLCRRGGNQLWRQVAPNSWRDVTAAARASGPGGDTVDGLFVDADHDGDLDLVLVGAGQSTELLNNNGDGTFRSIGQRAGVAGDGRPAIGVMAADLDGDRDLDLVVIKAHPPHDVFLNDRGWRYHRPPGAERFTHAAMSAAVAADANADGRVEIYASDGEGVSVWTSSRVGEWSAGHVAGSEEMARSRRLAVSDIIGDGRLSLVGTSAAGGWQAVALAGEAAGRVVASATQPAASAWTLAAFTPSSGPSVLAVAAGSGEPMMWKPGTGRWPYVALSLTGRDRQGAQIRSNASGIGTLVAARTGSRWTVLAQPAAHSGPGQSLQPLTVGTGGASQVDFVSLIWSDGVLQTEMDLAPGPVHRIEETERQLSSCPVLFAFDGTRYAFVTDVLGVGGVGFLEKPGAYTPARPRENLLLPVGALVAQDGRYRLKITEPMEEVTYLDAARLVAYDVPSGWSIALDERREVEGPVPTGAPRFFTQERLPVSAVTSEGADATAAVLKADGMAAPPGRIDPRFIGRTDEHTLTLEFGAPLDASPGEPVLVADGWIEYPYAQTMFAAWQAGAAYLAPSLEARDGAGRWRLVQRQFGYPAGMPRQMSFPLRGLPRGTTALRLRTTQEVYWDRLAVAFVEPMPQVVSHRIGLASARLATTGFARRSTGPFRRPSYDYDSRVPLWDTRHLSGFYTAEGPVDELVSAEDGAVAILGPGEEVQLEFTAGLDPPPPGWTRHFVVELRGWCKDMDLYTEHGDTVEPVPSPSSAARDRLHQRYNTRYASGR